MTLKEKKKQSLGERLKMARKEAGLSQKELAEDLQITDKAVSTYEVGRAQPSFEMIKKISLITQKPISFFDENFDLAEVDLLHKLDQVESELKAIRVLLQNKSK